MTLLFTLFSTLLLLLSSTFFSPTMAQTSSTETRQFSGHEYFLYLENADTRNEVMMLENRIQKKEGVRFFMADRFPVRYFRLRTERVITQDEFQRWVGREYPVLTFGEGDAARERAAVIYNQTKKAQHAH